jgi:hypothetical protein
MAFAHAHPVVRIAVVVSCIVGLAACGSDAPGATTHTTTHTTHTSTLPTVDQVVPIIGVHDDVAAYPACGNQPFVHLGVTWYPLFQEGFSPSDDDLQERADEVRNVNRQSPPSDAQGLVRVPPPGPGDDVGTLVVWADGVGRWTSDSGELDVWVVDDELTYDWVC